jgi:hypothetical protein
VVEENEQSEPVKTTGKGLLDKAKDLGQSKQASQLPSTRLGAKFACTPQLSMQKLLSGSVLESL